MEQLYITNYSPYLGTLVSILIVFPLILGNIIKRREKNKRKIGLVENILSILKYIILTIIVIILSFNKDILNIANANTFMAIAIFFYVLYYELYIRFIVRGRKQIDLYWPFIHIKVPIQICLAMGILFTTIWAKNILLIILSVVFGLLHIYTSYIYFKRNLAEYRDLFDDNRKLVSKKSIKGDIVPKGLNYVTVVVFIYNPKNRKWLMQKRSKNKGGKWATTSGHPKSGESSIEGMTTEIKEELGINISTEELKFIKTQKRKNKFVDIYYLEKNINLKEIIKQEDELTEVCYMTKKEVDAFYNANKFKKSHYEYFNILLNKIK